MAVNRDLIVYDGSARRIIEKLGFVLRLLRPGKTHSVISSLITKQHLMNMLCDNESNAENTARNFNAFNSAVDYIKITDGKNLPWFFRLRKTAMPKKRKKIVKRHINSNRRNIARCDMERYREQISGMIHYGDRL